METPHPYRQRVMKGGVILREFRGNTNEDDLIWHQDKSDRSVTVVKGNGWKLQLAEGLPFPLEEGCTYAIPARSWHRIVRGTGSLVVKIAEKGKDSMATRITESQLRKIIREEILNESPSYEKWTDSEDSENYTIQRVYAESANGELTPIDEAKSQKKKYGGKEYKSSSGSVAVIKKHGGSASKAVKAGAFDWADDPMAAAQAAHIVAMGEPTVAKGSKRKK